MAEIDKYWALQDPVPSTCEECGIQGMLLPDVDLLVVAVSGVGHVHVPDGGECMRRQIKQIRQQRDHLSVALRYIADKEQGAFGDLDTYDGLELNSVRDYAREALLRADLRP